VFKTLPTDPFLGVLPPALHWRIVRRMVQTLERMDGRGACNGSGNKRTGTGRCCWNDAASEGLE